MKLNELYLTAEQSADQIRAPLLLFCRTPSKGEQRTPPPASLAEAEQSTCPCCGTGTGANRAGARQGRAGAEQRRSRGGRAGADGARTGGR